MLQQIFTEFTPAVLALCGAMVFAGGFVKGAVGFALPMVAVSGMASFLPAETAVAFAVLAILFTNVLQALRGGLGQAWMSLLKFWRLNLTLLITLYLSAQYATNLPNDVLLLLLGAMISFFGAVQLIGWRPYLEPAFACRIEPFVGIFSGFFGGFSGVWGPPILMFLLARGTPKAEQVRIQGVSFLVGSVVLTGAFLKSGALDPVTLPISAALIAPAALGLVLGFRVHDLLPQETFRKLTLAVLVVAGLNLLRRGLGY